LIVFWTALIFPVLSPAQTSAPARTQEYFVQQAVDEDLLITINAFEAEFESKVSGSNGEILALSGVPGSRIVPLFQYIYAPKAARQLDIEVTSSLHSGRTEFGIELTRLKPWDSRSQSVSQAYKLLSFGSEIDASDGQANWTVKINSLSKASELFKQFGMQEMRLWANYLTAHLILFHLHDFSIVYSMSREILAETKGPRSQKIELATLQLQSLALIGLRKTGSLALPVDDTDPVQSVLAQTARLAETMGFYFEQARALYASGVEFAEQSLYSNALEQYQLAVKIADTIGSDELATAIRESIVQIHTIQGDAPATSEVLQEIESQLVEDGGGDQLALNLLAQARLLTAAYRYGEALEVLAGAMNVENNSAIRKQINFELAKVFYETGRFDDSITYLKLAEVNSESNQKRRGNSVIDVAEGLRILANIQRMKADYGPMQKTRNAQGQYQPATDLYLYEQGLDALAISSNNRQQAMSFFRQSQVAASQAGHVDLQHLAHLQYCALAGPGDGLCAKAGLKTSYAWLLGAGVPRLSAEAMVLWAQILVTDGQRNEELAVLDQLIDEIHLLRYSLKGVLGVWYWQRHEALFETYLKMLVTDTGSRGRADGSASLLALTKIRYIESYTGSELLVSGGSAESERLRAELAERANPEAGKSVLALNETINAALDKLRSSFNKEFEFLSSAGLHKYLHSLANDELLLTYHFSPTLAQVWAGQKGKVYRQDIANPSEAYQSLRDAQQGLADIGITPFKRKMDELGKRILTPVADLLTETIYWIPAGPLLGMPLDALRLHGHYLVEQHNVLNMLSFPVNNNPKNSLQVGPLQKVFLAGNPQDFSGDYAIRLETTAEIRAVTDIFVGPGLQIIQGAALLPDEFQGGFILDSNLIHLSMPGVINLKFPGESGLEMSESEFGPGRVILRPMDIRSQTLTAGLVFLSAPKLIGSPPSDFSSQPGLVSDFIAAGSRAVLVNFWADGAESDAVFIADFYRKLQTSGNTAESLRQAKLQYLKSNSDQGSYDWAGYQLFIR